jgi:hypothetical protein
MITCFTIAMSVPSNSATHTAIIAATSASV